MNLPLYRAHWELILAAVRESIPKAVPKIEAALQGKGDILGVDGRTESWRAVADAIDTGPLNAIANYIRHLCAACECAETLKGW